MADDDSGFGDTYPTGVGGDDGKGYGDSFSIRGGMGVFATGDGFGNGRGNGSGAYRGNGYGSVLGEGRGYGASAGPRCDDGSCLCGCECES